jgi:hypothetical protein
MNAARPASLTLSIVIAARYTGAIDVLVLVAGALLVSLIPARA